MDSSFWLEKWQNNEIGFHQSEGHPALPQHWLKLEPNASEHVLVPLCGKTRDLAWLARHGHAVHGVELSEHAATQFFAESDLDPAIQHRGSYDRHEAHFPQSGKVIIDVGNFFDVPDGNAHEFGLFFDRAALIALPPDIRRRYVSRLNDCLAPQARGLLVTLEYPAGALTGPPFSIGPDDVDALCAGLFDVEQVATRDVLTDYPGFAAQGMSWLVEHVFILKNQLT